MPGRARWRSSVLSLLFVMAADRAFAQIDLTGEWMSLVHQDIGLRNDAPDITARATDIRGAGGPQIGNYTGLPINDAARLRADSWDPRLPNSFEHQTIPNDAAPWWIQAAGGIRISKVVDPATERVIGLKIYRITVAGVAETRFVWLDGRAHPPEYAAHTWVGFSTGRWEGDMLTVETTHIKAALIRRNGVRTTDAATVVEHIVRHGGVLTIISLVTDPAYLEEPFIASQSWILDGRQQLPDPIIPEIVAEVPGQPEVYVPHYGLGNNPFLHEFAERVGLPFEATRGGKDTIYPEYQLKLQQMREHRPVATRSGTP